MKIYAIVWDNGHGWDDNVREYQYLFINKSNAEHMIHELDEQIEDRNKNNNPSCRDCYELVELETED